MHTPGLTNTPTTKLLLIYTLASSILLSILDAKHLASIHVSPHLWTYGQFWRCLLWQGAGFANSTEALFAAVLVYHCRVVERAWGSRKVVTFILSTLPYTTLVPPLFLACVVRPLSWNKLNYLPSGPTGVVFALLAQFYVTIPHTYRVRIATSASAASKPAQPAPSALLTDKSPSYLLAAQLALSQFPNMLLPAVVGWFVGMAWRADVLPGIGGGRRVPGWVVAEREVRRVRSGEGGGERRYDDLRRRLEGEVVAASGSSGGGGEGEGGQRRRNAGGFMERLRGTF